MVFTNGDQMESLSAKDTVSADDGKKNSHKNKDKKQKQTKSNVLDANSNTDNDYFLKLITDNSKKLGQHIKRILRFILIDLGGKQIIDRFAHWCVQHPHLAICLLAAVLVASLPILMFVAFALSTFVLTLTGFLVLEGTILTVITMIMFGLLGALGIFLSFCAFVGLATYFGVSRVYALYDSTEAGRKFNEKISVPNAN